MVVVDANRRQFPDAPPAPTGNGIGDVAVTIDPDAVPSASGLIVDNGVSPTNSIKPPPLVSGSTPVSTLPVQTSSQAPGTEPSDVGQTAASANTISIGTVVASCVGAFLGAGLFIVLGLFFYKRYSRSLKSKASSRALPRSPYKDASRASGGDGRRSNTWNRLEEGEFEDKWEGMQKLAPPADTTSNGLLTPSNGMDMFRKSPSDISQPSAGSMSYEMDTHPYAGAGHQKVPEARDLLGREPQHMIARIDAGPPLSWASESSKPSFLSATRLEGGAMSPTLAIAIPTPPATVSQPHHWESAEVINIVEPQSADIADDGCARTNQHNPFFSARNDYVVPSTQRSVSQSAGRSRSNSTATITQQPPKPVDFLSPEGPLDGGKVVGGKERVVSIDPFRDPFPRPSFMTHQATGSSSSHAENERAIKQLVAAAGMDLNEDEIQRRLKAISMQPSIISNSGDSMYTDAEPDFIHDDTIRHFPHPPSSIGHPS